MQLNSFKMLTFLILIVFASFADINSQVTVTEEKIAIPTYLVMDPDPNPVFFNGRRYQGAQGRVYPYPLTHNLTDSVADLEYNAVIIGNEYIEVCILPELGGRIYYAKDKRNDYYFLYYNRVIKPALIGMTGAWISGGVEWNIPHHHRASSFYPVEHTITENSNGSKTVWVGETELRHRSKWIVGITIHPGSILAEATVRVFNTTPFQNSILAWANAATHANEDYQIFFPPLTRHTTFHRKNQFSEWPVSNQFYDGADYTGGVDVSRWVNHIKSTSFFEWGNMGNFVAGIDHGKKAGTVIFGDKYMNPGKKLWSWGNNPSGAMWDGLLTDEDGPYVELMFGSFSDNQPDYSWIQTRETKETSYWFAPVIGMKGVKQVNENAVIDLEVRSDSLFATVNVTRVLESAAIILFSGDSIIFEIVEDMTPGEPYILDIKLEQDLLEREKEDKFSIALKDESGRLLAGYIIEKPGDEPLPKPVSSPLAAEVINDADSLYYAGLQFEQFHDPYYMPLDYYLKALSVNPDHVSALTRTGMVYLKAGEYENAAPHLEKAVARVTTDYSVSENGAPLYYLGLAYSEMGRYSDAYELFNRASWDYGFRSSSRYQLAIIDSRHGNFDMAMGHLQQAYSTNTRSIDILAMQASLYRKSGEIAKALQTVESLLELDPLNLRAYFERYLVTNHIEARRSFIGLMRNYHENYIELAVGYGNAGLYDDAISLLDIFVKLPEKSIDNNPEVYYLLGYYNHLSGSSVIAGEYFARAAGAGYRYSFPHRFESARALETALEYNPDDALAWYLTGNLFYDHQPGRAVEAWEKAVALGNEVPVAFRNLAFAYANIDKDAGAAIQNIEKAIALNPDDPRFYYEYDLYQKTLLTDPVKRLESFLQAHDVVVSDQISIFSYAELLTINGKYDQAIALMKERHFHRWEGGESIYLFWLYAHLFKTVTAIESNNLTEAELLVDAALSYPLNLQAVSSAHGPVAWYYKGLVAERLKRTAEAESCFMNAVQCRSGAPECDYFAALAYEKMNKGLASQSIFESMIKTGERELLAEEDMDFFDPFARVRSKHEIQAGAYLRIALGHHGLGDEQSARKNFNLAKQHNPAILSLVFRD